ncbi:MAG: aspartate aminotransferase family protein [Flavobacteriales bacterium]|nr:aspartate aminotransferase family protein [Flavobacteriales bacterium]
MDNFRIPDKAIEFEALFAQMSENKKDDLDWKRGRAFCLVYYPGEEKEELIRKAYNMYFTENALNPMVFPSLRKMENEVVAMVANLLHGDEGVRGSFTSGGTESILMAIKSARDYMAKTKPEITVPEMILPATAHPTFAKAIKYFGVKGVYVEADKNYCASPKNIEAAITENTILIVASATSYPHGVLDPIKEIGKIAKERALLFHVDACIGGFMLPFVEIITNKEMPFDFRAEGVTSISIDIHKYGYAAKGASVVLYRTAELRKHQFTVYTDWPGGIYGSLTMVGSRPGGTVAAAWATLMGIGMDGYLDMAKKTWGATQLIKEYINQSTDLILMGEPAMTIVAFSSKTIDIFELADELSIKGWHFERLCEPAGIHLTISQIHEQYMSEFIADLDQGIKQVQANTIKQITNKIKVGVMRRLVQVLPEGLIAKIQSSFSGKAAVKSDRIAPIYGMLGVLRGTEDMDEIVLDLLDKLNTPSPKK